MAANFTDLNAVSRITRVNEIKWDKRKMEVFRIRIDKQVLQRVLLKLM